ncbi:hypothetical protein NU219Hw_g315t1 [Hortaea werneckii]
MDGQSSMGAYQSQDVEMQEEDTEDFYGNEDVNEETKQQQDASVNLLNMLMPQEEHEHTQSTPPPPQPEQPPPQTPQPTTTLDPKTENQRRAEVLRAKLIAQKLTAQRQNTPKKAASVAAASRPETPAKQPSPPQTQGTPHQPPSGSLKPSQDTHNAHKMNGSSGDALGVDALLAEGKAAAEKAANKPNGSQLAKQSQPAVPATRSPNPPSATVAPRPSHPLPTSRLNPDSPPSKSQSMPSNLPATNLADSYYADLPAWLEFTGYHDPSYRSSKLAKYHERRALEAEVARIHARLEKLKQDEQVEMEALRANISHPYPNSTAPALPTEMPNFADAAGSRFTQSTNGVKRPHSPDPSPHPSATAGSEKLPRRYPPPGRQDNNDSPPGFRIRGANDSPSDSLHRPHFAPTSTHRPSPPLNFSERRLSYSHGGDPRGRRSSLDYGEDDRAPRSRDPSLERRQAYYQPSSRRDSERGGLPPFHSSFSSAPTVGGAGRYDSYTPRDPPPPPRYGGGAGAGKERGGGPRSGSVSGGRRGGLKEGYSSYGGGGRKGGR